MLKRAFLHRSVAAFLAFGVVGFSSESLADEVTRPKLGALLFYATDGSPSEVEGAIADAQGEGAKLSPSLGKAFSFKHFVLIGQHSARLAEKYNTWLLPSPQFPLEIENSGSLKSGGLSLFVKLWQKEKLPSKDRELLKTNAVLTSQAPLFIGGPKWRSGRLIVVLRREN